jgi:hypothetical protein
MGQEVVEECGGAAWVKRVVLRVESSEFWVRVYAMWGKSQEVSQECGIVGQTSGVTGRELAAQCCCTP